MTQPISIPDTHHYWLINAHVPAPLLIDADAIPAAGQPAAGQPVAELAWVDLEIKDGNITTIQAAGTPHTDGLPIVDVQRGQIWPCFVDVHTHLDKGHIWPRSPNSDGRFETALETVQADREQYWTVEDVYHRMAFGLKCSYAHGTRAIRTHIDSLDGQAAISLEAVKALQAEWRDRLVLQPVSLLPLDAFMTSEGKTLADQFAQVGGVLGGLPLMSQELDAQLDRVFQLAMERGLDLDFHTDESGEPTDITLRHVAAAALRHNFTGQIVCGHCCSLAVQSQAEAMKTVALVKQAGIGVVSLPMCNLYLQDRNQRTSRNFTHLLNPSLEQQLAFEPEFPSHTPRWRGVTLLHELKHYGVPVAIASDNCRDPFYGFGDHDALEVFTQSTRIAHFDAPYGDWCKTVTTTPADWMRLPTVGRIGVGLPADLVLFKARYYSELLSRPQSDRVVLRKGQAIDTTLPDYAELDPILQG